MRARILGCGPSSGLPMIGDLWGTCDPHEPRNRRTRTSILLEVGATRILVDTSPDLREQLLAAGVGTVSAVLYTHAHADHVHGLDELRMINWNLDGWLDAYGDRDTLDQVKARFGYAFDPVPRTRPDGRLIFNRPYLRPREVTPGEGFAIDGVPIMPIRQDHGSGGLSLGYRFGDGLGYSTDVFDLSEEAFAALAGIEVWIVGALRPQPAHAHANLERVLGWVDRLRPQRTILVHMAEDMDYATLRRELPAGVEPGYDGLVIDL